LLILHAFVCLCARADVSVLLRHKRERSSAQTDPLFDHVGVRVATDAGPEVLGTFLGPPIALTYAPPSPVVHLLTDEVMAR
jgi:hypothetical protein